MKLKPPMIPFAQRNLEESFKFTSIGLKQTSKHHLVKSSDYNSSMGTGAKNSPMKTSFPTASE